MNPIPPEAVELVLAALHGAGDRPRLAVAGGSVTPVLGMVRRQAGSIWRSIRLTWVDERCVSFGSSLSNRGAAYAQGALSLEDPCALELPLFLDGETPQSACIRVRQSLDRDFGGALDVLLLGMGEDGHIASLFPGRPWQVDDQVFPVAESPKPPSCRITLAMPLLVKVEKTVLVVMGEGKRWALERLACGDHSLPAVALKNVSIVTDIW